VADRRAVIDECLCCLPDEQAEAWMIWLQRHQIDDWRWIVLDTEIVCDDTSRIITYEVFRRGQDGNVIIDPDDDERCLTDRVVVQLEAPALPLPAGYLVEGPDA
jgi:hypothetical protein